MSDVLGVLQTQLQAAEDAHTANLAHYHGALERKAEAEAEARAANEVASESANTLHLLRKTVHDFERANVAPAQTEVKVDEVPGES